MDWGDQLTPPGKWFPYGCLVAIPYMMYWPKTKEQIKAFIHDCIAAMNSERPARYEWVMQLKPAAIVIGNITLEIKNSEAEMGWISNKEYWNHGYMSEAVRRVIQFVFLNLGIDKIVATCTDQNIGSYKVMEKCHMKRRFEEHNLTVLRQGVEVTYNKLTYCICRE